MILGGYTPQHSVEEIKKLAADFSVNTILKQHAYQHKPLDFTTAYLLGIFTLYPYKQELEGIFNLDQETAEKQSIAALCALHTQETYRRDGAAAQIAGIVAAIFDYDLATSEYGFLKPNVECVMDNCGMGGDLYRTPNVSSLAALIAAADGIVMGKHGSPGNTDSTGSSDFLKYCGVDLFSTKQRVEQGLERFAFGYTDALDTRYKTVHVQTHQSAKLAHMNDIIGPMTNPVLPKLLQKRVLGVNHLVEPKVIAEAYRILNEKGITQLDHGLFVRGFVTEDRIGGIDEVSVFSGGTTVAELKKGTIKTYTLSAEDFGIATQNYFEVPKAKAAFSKGILEGKVTGTPRDLILANAALLFYLAKDVSFPEGFSRAREILGSGLPVDNLRGYNQLLEEQHD